MHSFREELDTQGTRIVEPDSATIGYLRETRGSLYANHRDMGKFSSMEDTNFLRIIGVLRKWTSEAPGYRDVKLLTLSTNLNLQNHPDGLVFDEVYQICLDSLDVPMSRTIV